jgi:hypothetical protein
MDRGKVLVFALADRMGGNHQMLEAWACWLFPGQAGRNPPHRNNTTVGQQDDTRVAPAVEGYRGKWLRE